jgi:hypothetical protein
MAALHLRFPYLICVAVLAVACGPGEPKTDAERLARGRQLIERMSAKLGSADSFSVKTHEIRDQIKTGGAIQHVTVDRETVLRRKPDRLYSKSSGDQRNEVWYDGVGVTVAMHQHKVFGQARMPETLDKTLDSMHERYGVALPIADFFYSSPAKALVPPTTTGGWVGRETLDGQQTEHLTFADTGVKWEIWLASEGDSLPKKAMVEFSENPRLKKTEVTFSDWNFAPQVAANQFDPAVPQDYEGVAIVQRARALRNMPKDEPAPTSGEVKK